MILGIDPKVDYAFKHLLGREATRPILIDVLDAILNPDPADVPELGRVLAFLKTQDQPALPVMANIGVVDDQSAVEIDM